MELFTFKRCFAFFAESNHAFLLVSRGEAEAEDFSFISDTRYDVAVDTAVDGSFGELYSLTTAGISSSCGKTSLTKPIAFAFSASIMPPV